MTARATCVSRVKQKFFFHSRKELGVRKWDDQEWYDGTVDRKMFYPEASLFSGGEEEAVKERLYAGSTSAGWGSGASSGTWEERSLTKVCSD